MKSVYKTILSLCIAFTAFMMISCSDFIGPMDFSDSSYPSQNGTNIEGLPDYYKNAINKVGSVNKVFSSPNASARFFTGQNVKSFFWDMDNNIIFEANLVEYNSVDPFLLNYVESIPQNNAWMHQGYGNIAYDENKKYVEFATYYDKDFNEVVQHEIRIFYGNFWNDFNDGKWYAKSVTFSPDLTIDINNNKNIRTGQEAHYEYPHKYLLNSSLDYSKYDLKEVSSFSDNIKKLGDNPKVYKYQLKNGMKDEYYPIERNYSNVEYNYFDCYLVEYNSFISFIDGYNNIGKGTKSDFRYQYDNLKENKKYLEYIVYTGDQTNKVNFIELRMKNDDGTITKHKFSTQKFNTLIDAINNNMSVEEYAPFYSKNIEAIKTLGTNPTSYPLNYEIDDDWSWDCYVEARLFSFDSYTQKVTDQIKILEQKNKEHIYFNYSNNRFNENKQYLEVLCFIDKESGKIKYYDFHFRIPTNDNKAYSMTLIPSKFDSFTNPDDNSIPIKSNSLDSVEKYEGPKTYKEAIQKLGKVNKIYTASDYIPRYMTGQNIRHYNGWKNQIQFEGNLIEYDSIDPTYQQYFEKYEATDGCMHQNYPEASYNPNKKYIEVSCYKDLDNKGEIVKFEIRIFEGNPLDSRNKRMQRNFSLSPDLTIDMSHNIVIETGKEGYYQYPNAEWVDNNMDSSKWESVETTLSIPELENLGNINKVYKNQLKQDQTDTYERIEQYYSNDEDLSYDSYLIEFNSINPLLKTYMDNTYNKTAFRERYDINYDNNKTYAEYLVYTGIKTNKVQVVELRIKDENDNIKLISLSTKLKDTFLKYLKGQMSLEEYDPIKVSVTEKMKSIGNFTKCFDFAYYSSWLNREADSYLTSRLFEYSSLNYKGLQKYDECKQNDEKTGNWWYLQNDYNTCEYSNDKRYVEVIITMDRTTHKPIRYQLRFKEPTKWDAHGTNLSVSEFDNFTAN